MSQASKAADVSFNIMQFANLNNWHNLDFEELSPVLMNI